eukprot:TRINITY_DN66741_c2_g2_i5.p2 TRINITY_DN66741_c2_g2~~TRINITY_DN66741_c2_g2_i5.p2  ORF type:complete len:110 (-),score=6.12 TRINITY_DN66741_c2_g2_i5:294-623(-)
MRLFHHEQKHIKQIMPPCKLVVVWHPTMNQTVLLFLLVFSFLTSPCGSMWTGLLVIAQCCNVLVQLSSPVNHSFSSQLSAMFSSTLLAHFQTVNIPAHLRGVGARASSV